MRITIGKLLICLALAAIWLSTSAQNRDRLLQNLKSSGVDSNRIVTLLKLGRYYLDKPGDDKIDMDSTAFYINKAAKLSEDLHLTYYVYECVLANACLTATLHDFEKANRLFTQAARYYENSGNKRKAAEIWELYGNWIWYVDTEHSDFRAKAYLNAYGILSSLNEKQKAADILGQVADAYLRAGKLDAAEKAIESAIEQYKLLKYSKIYYGYYILGEILYRKNDIKKGLIARIETANSFDNDPTGKPLEGARFYFNLAGAYYNDMQNQNALEAYVRCMEYAIKAGAKDYYYLSVRGAGLCYSKLHRFHEGITFFENNDDRFPKKSPYDEMLILSAKLQLYTQGGQLQKAAALIGPFRNVAHKVLADIGNQTEYYKIDNYIAISDPLLRYFIKAGKWDDFLNSLRQLESLPKTGQSILIKRRMLDYSYTRDSISGNLMAALRRYRQITRINDSINNAAATKHIRELEARYRSLAKDKTIQGLHNESLMQKERLRRRSTQLYSSLIGSLLFLILTCTLYYAYNQKKKANVALRSKQAQINEQNHQLSALLTDKETLIEEKDSLLVEKELLLREVHHRVKNNLQIVISLLYSQSSHSKNPEAIRAIRNVQDQIQSISIIHQKLYKKSGISTIRLSEYVQDLIGYLSGVYMPKLRKVKITQELDVIDLDTGQAVPIGLIMNEAITNSIKYAFSESGGEIKIIAKYLQPRLVKLVIADNGPGFRDIMKNDPPSLGLEMMKALARQINGTFEWKNEGGALISIVFKINSHEFSMLETGILPR
ncbi:sensor histidine kinase [Mucilaginibacter endophyticus]|uniref:sensor histidine kinase n=1 Tax=Mucilaginibacter endophyticus TaxID=2675003 RepID=UPI000E0D8049|nr:sensor histidine kinase [Mucilaginibacter endophyticus]